MSDEQKNGINEENKEKTTGALTFIGISVFCPYCDYSAFSNPAVMLRVVKYHVESQ